MPGAAGGEMKVWGKGDGEELIFVERGRVRACGLWVWGRECRMVVCGRSWCLVLCGVWKRGEEHDDDISCDTKRGKIDEASGVLLGFAKHWSWPDGVVVLGT
jgi:hypothetical protein